MRPCPNYFAAPGLRLAVHESGGSGQPFVFQHGLCGDAAQTAEVFPDNPRFRRLTLECRGHGGSDAGDPAGFCIAGFADDLAGFLEARDLGRAVVGGISLGAAIALRLAVRRPDLVRAMVLARPAWLTGPAPKNLAPYVEVGRLLQEFPAAEARARFACSATAGRLAREAPDNFTSLNGFFDRQPQAVTAALLTAIASDGPGVTVDEVRSLAVPACVIGHGRDLAHPFEHAEALASLIPNARLIRITPKADNRTRYVQEFRAGLQNFLDDLL